MNTKYVYIVTVLHNGNDFTYNQCILDFDEVLKDAFEEGFLLSNKMYFFFSNEGYLDIEKRLDQLKENSSINYSYCLSDITDQILNDRFRLDIDRLYINQIEISDKLKKNIEDFKRNKNESKVRADKEPTKEEIIDQILDKINRDGKESLTPKELEILKNL